MDKWSSVVKWNSRHRMVSPESNDDQALVSPTHHLFF